MSNDPDQQGGFVTCPCQNCNGRIEFDASGFEKGETRNVECPHCHLETVIFVHLKPKPVAPKPAVAPLKPQIAAPSSKVRVELFHYKIGSLVKGPYTFDQLLTLWNNGQITGDALFRNGQSEEWKPLADRIGQQSTNLSAPLKNIKNLILKFVCIISCVAFFLPNAAVSIPIFGKFEVSMFDFFTPKPTETTASQDSTAPAKINYTDVTGKIKDINIGVFICAFSVIGILVHYLLTIVWSIVNFAYKRTLPKFLDLAWLYCALQFPILFSIGAHLALRAFKADAIKSAASDPGDNSAGAAIGDALGNAFINQISVQPGSIMWVLMVFAILALALPVLARQMKPSV